MNVSSCSTALYSTTTESNSTTGEPSTKEIKKEGPVDTAGQYSVVLLQMYK